MNITDTLGRRQGKWHEATHIGVRRGNYKDGKKFGLWIMEKDGFILERCHYNFDGELDGEYIRFDYKGLKSKTMFKNGFRNGYDSRYTTIGTKSVPYNKCYYINNSLDYEIQHFYDNSLLSVVFTKYLKKGATFNLIHQEDYE